MKRTTTFGDKLSFKDSLQAIVSPLINGKKEEYDADKGYDRWTVHFLEIPINVAFKFKGFQAYAGPFVAIALSGKNKWDIDFDGESDSDSESLKFGSPVDIEDLDSEYDFLAYHFKRFDYGLNIGAGYKLGPILFSAGYSLGLANLTPDLNGEEEYIGESFDPKDAKRSTGTFSVTVSYFFGKWKE